MCGMQFCKNYKNALIVFLGLLLFNVVNIVDLWGQEVKLGCFVAIPQRVNINNIPDNISCENKTIWIAQGESEGFSLVAEGLSLSYEMEIKPAKPDTSLQFSVYRVSPVYYRDRIGLKHEVLDKLEPMYLGHKMKPLDAFEIMWIRVHSSFVAKNQKIALTIKLKSDKKEYRTEAHIQLVDIQMNDAPVMFINANFTLPAVEDNSALDGHVIRMAEFLRKWDINSLSGAVAARHLTDPDLVYEELFQRIKIKRVRLDFLNMRKYRDIIVGNKDDEWSNKTLESIFLNRQLIKNYGNKLQIKAWDEPAEENMALLKKGYELLKKNSPSTLMELTAPPKQELFDYVDIFIPRINDIRESDVKRARAAGKDVYFYANNMNSIRLPSHVLRNIGWLAYTLGANGYHIWCVNCWDGAHVDGTIGGNYNFETGALLYPAGNIGNPWPSFRLEMIKDAAEDFRIYHAIGMNTSVKKNIFANERKNGMYNFKEGKKSYDNDARILHDRILQAVFEERQSR
jgi:hypothetical protein